MSHETVVIAAGGTGGHVIPAIALAKSLSDLGSDVKLLHDKRVRHIVLRHGRINAVELAFGHGFAPHYISRFIKYLMVLINAFYLMIVFSFKRPDMVIGFGGYVSAPALLAARILLIRIGLVEQNSVVGAVNRAFVKKAVVIFTAFERVKGLPLSANKLPIAMIVGKDFYEPEAPNLPKSKKNNPIKILITGGSQGARSFAELIPNALENVDEALRAKLHLYFQVPEQFVKSTIGALKRLGVKSYEVKSFFYDMPKLLKGSDFVIARGGASTIAELCAAKKAAILMPLKHSKDQHQYYNIKQLSDVEAAVLLEEGSNLRHDLAYWIAELAVNSDQRLRFAENAALFYNPDNLEMMSSIIHSIAARN